MSYKALYREYRPQIFDDVYGQKHITDILKAQIVNDKVSHAYLLCGPRGTGKTSTAKIFGNAINCLNSKDGNPCLECEVCKAFKKDALMDIIEIDAASNNSVDNIRDLRDKIALLPVLGKYKVYIIDEVHMLSSGAFNALLKTLEEPPPHGIFILATTELRKLPDTIRSRCQRYDFKRITTQDIIARLKYVGDSMGISYEEKALEIIATSAKGALRDALSIMDTCLDNLTAEGVQNAIGSPEDEKIALLCDAITGENAKQALELTSQMCQRGIEPHNILSDVIVTLSQTLAKEVANSYNCIKILRSLEVLIYSQNTLRYSYTPEETLICTILRATVNSTDVDTKDIEHRIKSIENRIEKLENGGIVDWANVTNVQAAEATKAVTAQTPTAQALTAQAPSAQAPTAQEQQQAQSPTDIAPQQAQAHETQTMVDQSQSTTDAKGFLKGFTIKIKESIPELAPSVSKISEVKITGNVLELHVSKEDSVLVEMLLLKAYKEKIDAIIKEIAGKLLQLQIVHTTEEDFTQALADIVGKDNIIIK